MKPTDFINMFARVRMAALLVVLFAPAGPAVATTAAPETIITLDVSRKDGISIPSYRARADSFPYEVYVSIELQGGFFPDGNLYVGVIRPGGEVAFTFVDDVGKARLQRGMAPLLYDVDLYGPKSINVNQTYGKPIELSFSPDDPRGMYLVFAVIVVGDEPPSAGTNWFGAELQPVFVE